MSKQNKSVSASNLINLAGVFAIFALIGFCCWFGKTSSNPAASAMGDSSKSAEVARVQKNSGKTK